MQRNNIPDGWLLKKLNQISTFESGGTPSKSVDEFWVNGDIKWLSAKYIDQDKIIGCDYITKQGLDNSSAKMTNFGDIILVTRVSVGKIVFVEEEFAVNQDLTIIKTDDTNKKFLFYVLKNKTKDIIDKSQGLAIKGITKEELSNIKVLVPPLPEQKKIAEILGTWDRAIEELSDLITEKKELKRSLMQQLLTGEIRISGFTKPWKKVKLGEIGTTYTGLNGKNKDDFGKGSYFIPYMNVYQNNKIDPKHLELVEVFDNENQNIVQYGDIFFTTSSETPEEVGFASVLLFKPEQKIYLNSFCFGYRLNNFDTLLPNYASFLFRSKQMRKIMYKLAQGATRFNLSKNELMKERVYIPVDISEQHAIADVLSTIDCEIDLLNQRLDVLKEQKRGLMQKLLTGEIRVKVDVE